MYEFITRTKKQNSFFLLLIFKVKKIKEPNGPFTLILKPKNGLNFSIKNG